MRLLLLALFASLFPLPLLADTRADLIAQMETSGKHAFDDENHSVKVEGCTIITERWKNVPDHGWVLWTSLTFAMMDAVLDEDRNVPGQRFFYVPAKDAPKNDLMFISFKTREGTTARHEKSVMRKSRKQTRPSPRNDGTTHFYEEQVSFFILFKGEGVYEKGFGFTTAYRQYKQDYCTFTG